MITSISNYTNSSALMNMQADIQVLKDKATVYYNSYGDIPKCAETYFETIDTSGGNITVYKISEGTIINEEFIEDRDGEDGDIYYQIDTTKLNNVTLNFGTNEDIYIINARTLNVYYTNGVMSEDEMHYTY
ncbi:MAG: hypothetical protein E7310_02840 [Clostridiales bacterium]|nr:hypothetical protein [Clostridiales bacterium]